VRVKHRPELNREFPPYKAAEAQAYRDQLVTEKHLEAQIERGPLKLLVRIRTRGQPPPYKTVHSYEEAEKFELLTRADEIRGVAVARDPARRTTCLPAMLSPFGQRLV